METKKNKKNKEKGFGKKLWKVAKTTGKIIFFIIGLLGTITIPFLVLLMS